jgi:TolB protein
MLTNTADFSEHAPRWSPDGTKIVYMGHPQFGENDQRELQDIWVMDADGQHKTQLTNTPRREEVPAWTADGRIVYCGQAADDLDNWDIYLINADGSGLRRLTSSPTFDCWPSPAPSGNRLAYTTVRDDVAEIVTMTLGGTDLREVTTGVDTNCVQSDWSPAGNDLVFACDNETGTGRDVWTAHHNGIGLRQLTDTPNNHEAFPSWSPDGTRSCSAGSSRTASSTSSPSIRSAERRSCCSPRRRRRPSPSPIRRGSRSATNGHRDVRRSKPS